MSSGNDHKFTGTTLQKTASFDIRTPAIFHDGRGIRVAITLKVFSPGGSIDFQSVGIQFSRTSQPRERSWSNPENSSAPQAPPWPVRDNGSDTAGFNL